MSKLGDRLKELRKQKNIQQKQLAKEVGIPISTLANYENNHRLPNLKTIHAIADVLGVDSIQIIQGNTPVTTKEIIIYLNNCGLSLDKISEEINCNVKDLQNFLNKSDESLGSFSEYHIDGLLRSKFHLPILSEAESELLAMHKAQAMLGLAYTNVSETITPSSDRIQPQNENNLYSSLDILIEYACSVTGKVISLNKLEKEQLLDQFIDLIDINIRKKERKNRLK